MSDAQTYLQIFLADNEQLINYLAAYNNIKLSATALIQQKNPEEQSQSSISPMQSDKIMETIAFFRSYVTRTHIKFNSIKNLLGARPEQINQVDMAYQHISTTNIPDFKQCEKYVQTLNDILTININAIGAIDRKRQTKEYADMAAVSDVIES